MKIKMTVAISGNRDGRKWPPIGGVAEVPDQEGAELCAAGMAKPVVEDKVEKAIPPKDEEQRELTTESAESVVRQPRQRKPRPSAE